MSILSGWFWLLNVEYFTTTSEFSLFLEWTTISGCVEVVQMVLWALPVLAVGIASITPTLFTFYLLLGRLSMLWIQIFSPLRLAVPLPQEKIEWWRQPGTRGRISEIHTSNTEEQWPWGRRRKWGRGKEKQYTLPEWRKTYLMRTRAKKGEMASVSSPTEHGRSQRFRCKEQLEPGYFAVYPTGVSHCTAALWTRLWHFWLPGVALSMPG